MTAPSPPPACPTCGRTDGFHDEWASPMPSPPPEHGRICVHGSLARKCEICERDAEIAELKARADAIEADNKRLREALERARRPHVVVDDCWYSCPLALDEDGLSECCDEETVRRGVCVCGAAEHNAAIDAALRAPQEGGEK